MIVTIDAENNTASVLPDTPADIDGVAVALEEVKKVKTGKVYLDMPYNQNNIAVIVVEERK